MARKNSNPIVAWLADSKDENMDKSLIDAPQESLPAEEAQRVAVALGKIQHECEALAKQLEMLSAYPALERESAAAEMALLVYEKLELMRYEIRKCEPYWLLPTPFSGRHQSQVSTIDISQPEGCLLKMVLFPLVNFPTKGGYNVYSELKQALDAYLENHPVKVVPGGKYTLLYRRIVPGPLTLGQGRCDNDNFEMKRCTNAITDALGFADSVDKVSFFYTTDTLDGVSCVEIYLLAEKDVLGEKMPQLFR